MGKKVNKNRLFQREAIYANKTLASTSKHCPLSGGGGREDTELGGPTAGLGFTCTGKALGSSSGTMGHMGRCSASRLTEL